MIDWPSFWLGVGALLAVEAVATMVLIRICAR
jgi:hypothetical protein